MLPSINYSNQKTQGMAYSRKQVRITPQSYQNNIGMNDIVRFIMNVDGFWDPYNAYILLEVDTSEASSLQQLEGSAQSFINELIITSEGVEIERIQEYDVLADMIYDLNYCDAQRQQHQMEGLGTMKVSDKLQQFRQATSNRPAMSWDTLSQKPKISYVSDQSNWANLQSPIYNREIVRSERGNTLVKFEDLFPDNINYSNITSDRVEVTSFLGQADTTANLLCAHPIPNRLEQLLLNNYDYSPSKIQAGQNQPNIWVGPFCDTTFEPIFGNKTQKVVDNGKFSQSLTVQKQRFVIPLLSSIFGILLPAENYKYIPMQYMKDLCFEFRMNPYAMFTSGYSNENTEGTIALTDVFANRSKYSIYQPLTTQQVRKWKFTKFEIWADIVSFPEAVQQQINQQYQSGGLIINSQSFQLGPLYQMTDTANCTGTFQVNLGFESMKNILLGYYSNDYLNYSFCRKHYRLSSNITKLQLKVGTEYHPIQPIEGHGGKQFANDLVNGNNFQFVANLYKCFGKLNDVDQNIFINCWNFAPNERIYDVTNTASMFGGVSGTVTATNMDTALGLPLWYENMCIGKALYGINFELQHTSEGITGINTMAARPFEINVTTDSATVNASRDRKRTMYIWCHYDYILKISPQGIQLLGRA